LEQVFCWLDAIFVAELTMSWEILNYRYTDFEIYMSALLSAVVWFCLGNCVSSQWTWYLWISAQPRLQNLFRYRKSHRICCSTFSVLLFCFCFVYPRHFQQLLYYFFILYDHFEEDLIKQQLNDIHVLCVLQLTSLCWTHGLYDAVLYVYNRGMSDYVTPLVQLLAVLKLAVDSGSQLTYQQVYITG